jgi:eukaryotic-like serine/threonine-protein kinase
VHSWARQQNGSTFILYSSQNGETWRLYRVGVSDSGHAISQPELLISGFGELGSAGFANGHVVYSVGHRSEQLFQIPIDGYGRKRGPINELPLPEGPLYYSPSVSRAGDRLAYFQAEFGKPKSLIFKDLGSGRSRVLDNSVGPTRDGSASLSPDGSKIVFNRWCDMDGKPNCPSFLVPAAGGKPELLCENCMARGFSSNGSFVLMQKYASRAAGEGLDKITAVDLATKQEREVLSDPRHPVYHAFLSRDDRWIVFKRWISWTKSQIMMAPVRDGRAAPEGEWVALTDGRFCDDKPQITGASDFVYFTSDRDGYLCVWAQRLDVRTKHPIDQPRAVEHFHNSTGRDAVNFPGNQGMVDLTMAADKLFINLPLRRADIWTLALK